MGLAVPTRVSALNKGEIMALVFDTSPAVRARVCRVAGDLLTHTSDQHLGAAKPRFFALLLAGTFDPVDTVSQAAEEELQRLAEKYDKSRTMDKGKRGRRVWRGGVGAGVICFADRLTWNRLDALHADVLPIVLRRRHARRRSCL